MGLSPAACGQPTKVLRQGMALNKLVLGGNLHLSSVWEASEERRAIGEEALSLARQSGWGPRGVAEGIERKKQIANFRKEDG